MTTSRTALDSLRSALAGRASAWSVLAALSVALVAPLAARADEPLADSWDRTCAALGVQAGTCAELSAAPDAAALGRALAGAGLDLSALLLVDLTQGLSAPPLPLTTLDTARSALRGTAASPFSPAAVSPWHAAPPVPAAAPQPALERLVLPATRPAASGAPARAP